MIRSLKKASLTHFVIFSYIYKTVIYLQYIINISFTTNILLYLMRNNALSNYIQKTINSKKIVNS